MRTILLLITIIFCAPFIRAQEIDTVFSENFNLAITTTAINAYPFSQTNPISGNASIRTTRQSQNYTQASAGGNVFFNNDHSFFSVNVINVSHLADLQIGFGLMKQGNDLDGSNFVITIIAHGVSNDTFTYSPTLSTGQNTSNWRYIALPTITLNDVNTIDITFAVTTYTNSSHEYRIDDIYLFGERDIPLFNVFKEFIINSENQLEYELEALNSHYNFLTIERSKNGKEFEIFKKIDQPILTDRFQIDYSDYKFYRLVVSLDNIEFTSTIRNILDNENIYWYGGKQIIYSSTQHQVHVYNLEGKLIKTYNNVNILDFSEYNNQIILIKDQYKVHKLLVE